jgi:hypothetical protein
MINRRLLPHIEHRPQPHVPAGHGPNGGCRICALQPRAIEDFPLATTSTAVNYALMFVDHTLRRWSMMNLLRPVALFVTELGG